MKSTTPAGPTSPHAELARQLLGLFEQAGDNSGHEDAFVDLAERTVRLRFAGTAMSDRLLPALAHLKVEPVADPALTVNIWDSGSTSTPVLVAPWGPDDFRQRGIIRGYYGDGFYTVYDWGPKALVVIDTADGHAFYWKRESDTAPLDERGAPLKALFNLWLRSGETQLLHSAAVGTREGCVLLVGHSGAGKSSTALSCFGSGLKHIGEDYCMVTRGDPPMVTSIYSSAKLTLDALARLPHLAGLETTMPDPDDADGKVLVDLAASAPDELLRSAPLAAIAVPRIVEGRAGTTSSRCSASSVLAAVAPSTMLQLPGNDEGTWRWLTDLVRSVPCHELEVGSDPALIPPAVEKLLVDP